MSDLPLKPTLNSNILKSHLPITCFSVAQSAWNFVQSTYLTHSGQAMPICVSKVIIIGSDYGLSPGWCQAIIWTNARILLLGPQGTNFSEISTKIHTSSLRKMCLKNMVWKMLAILSRPQCVNWRAWTKLLCFFSAAVIVITIKVLNVSICILT